MPPSRITGLGPLLGWGLLAALVLLCSIPKASTIVFTWPWVFYSQALLITPLFLLAASRWHSTPGPRATGLAATLVAAAIGLSVIQSRQPHFSFEAALPLWSGLAWTFWLAAALRRQDTASFLRFRRLCGVLLLIPLVTSAALYTKELHDVMTAAGTWHIEFTYHRNSHPLGHWNYTGGLSLLTLPWLAALAWSEKGRWRLLWGTGVLLATAIFVSASSRGAVLGALTGAAMASGLWFSLHRPSYRQSLTAAAAALLLVIGLLATNPRLRALATDPASLFRPGEGDVQRLGMAQAGLLLGSQRPWVGHGPGMVPFVYPEVRAQLIGGVETSYQLHNGPLHWWVTTGALGMAALAAFLGAGVYALRRWLRQTPGSRRSFALASSCALAAYAGLALTDYQLDVIAIITLLGLHAGTVLGLASPADGLPTPGARRSSPQPWRRIESVGLIGAGLLGLAVLGFHWHARQLHWAALADTPATERVLLAQRLLRAVEAAPWCTHYRNAVGFQLARAAESAPDAAPLRRAARQILSSSLKIDPAQEPVQAALGWLWLPDDSAQARTHFEASLRLLPDRPSAHLGLALACLAQEDRSSCVQALAMEILLNSFFIASPLWNREPLAEVRADAYARWLTLSDQLLADPRLPAWRRPLFAYSRAVTRWWQEGRQPTLDELSGAQPAQRAVFSFLAGTTPEPTTLPQPWGDLQQVLDSPQERTIDASAVALPGVPPPALANLQDRVNAPGATLGTCLRTPSMPGAPLTRTSVYRGHYSLMHRNLDGPGYADLAPYLDDPFLAFFVAPLFPPRGLLTGPFPTIRGASQPAPPK